MNNSWTFIPNKEKQDAYENIINKLNIYEPQTFNLLPSEEQENIIQQIIKEIRTINVFPIFYFNHKGVIEEIKKTQEKSVCFINDKLETFATEGLLLLDFLFPNLHSVESGNIKNNCMYDRFYDDKKLAKCLRQYLPTRKIYNMRTVFFSTARYIWNTAINFSPIRAKAIYERFCPENGTIYDYSCGYGGRMLGALSSDKNFTYIGCEPNTETYSNLLKLGKYIEEVTKRENSYNILNMCSEDYQPTKNSIDFCFSCPPFFKLERYSAEETQSINKFSEYQDWLELYVRPTIQKCFLAVKEEGLYGVDIMNCWIGNKKYNLVEDWINIAQEEGFILKGIYPIVSRARKKTNQDQENIYIFSKNANTNTLNYTDKKLLEQYQQEVEKKKNKTYTIVEYDHKGQLSKIDISYHNFAAPEEEIKKSIKSKKNYKDKFYRLYKNGEKVLEKINVKEVFCKIDDLYFNSFAEAGRYLGVSRQSVAQSKNRKSKTIANHKIEWL